MYCYVTPNRLEGGGGEGPGGIMTELAVALLIVNTLTGLGQLVLTWYMMRELGDLDKNRSDWWEKLEDKWEAARRLRGATQYLRGRSGRK